MFRYTFFVFHSYHSEWVCVRERARSVLFNDIVSWWGFIASVVDGWNVNIKQWSNTGREKLMCSEWNLSQCQFVYHKSHMEWAGIELVRPQWGLDVWPFVTWTSQERSGMNHRDEEMCDTWEERKQRAKNISKQTIDNHDNYSDNWRFCLWFWNSNHCTSKLFAQHCTLQRVNTHCTKQEWSFRT